MMAAVAQRVAAGETVTFRPVGNSMVPIVHSRDEVVVAPCRPEALEVGDVVLARVAGSVYLHTVTAVNHQRGRVQIGNNRGRINGWTSHAKVYGIAIEIAGRARTSGSKVRAAN